VRELQGVVVVELRAFRAEFSSDGSFLVFKFFRLARTLFIFEVKVFQRAVVSIFASTRAFASGTMNHFNDFNGAPF